MESDGRPRTAWQRLGSGLIDAAVLGVLVAVVGVGIWGFWGFLHADHMRVTDCRFDSTGAYGKVEVTNLLGGAHEAAVLVDFYVGNQDIPYEGTSAQVMVPEHGRGTAAVHERFPAPADNVEGRTVYVVGRDREHPRLVSKKFALKHPEWTAIETVPDDPNSLSCSVEPDDPD